MPSLPSPWTETRLLQERRGVETWEARRENRRCLLKASRNPETVFQREFEFLSGIEHPGLPRPLHYERAAGLELYAREFLEAEPLESFFGKLPASRIAQVLAQSLRALAALHFRGFAHGDLSGGNILLHPQRGAVLIDFEFLAPRHQSGSGIRGTPRCMAPELFWGKAPTIQTDLYAVGCILYGLLSGQYPFLAGDFETLLQQHALEAPHNPCIGRPELPRALGLIALRLLAKEPAQRFADANEAVTALNRALGLREALEPTPSVLAPQERLRAERAYSHEREALRFLQEKKSLTERERITLAELLLKTERLDELEALLPNLPEAARALFQGLGLNRRGRYAEALAHFARHPCAEDPRGLLGRATALYHNGRGAEALELLQKIRPREEGAPAAAAVWNNFAGNLLLFERRLDEAEAAYRRALDGAREAGAAALEALVAMNLGNVRQAKGDWREALEDYLRACELYEALGLSVDKARAELNLAGLKRFSGQLEKSHELIASAEAALGARPHPQLISYARLLRADLAKKRGDFPEALLLLEAETEPNLGGSDRGDRLAALAEIHWAKGDDVRAAEALSEAKAWAEESGDALLEQRVEFLSRLLAGFQAGALQAEPIVFAAEALRGQGDVEFLLDNLLRGRERAKKLGLPWPESLRRWALRLAETAEAALPGDDRAFFRQLHRPLWEHNAMTPTPTATPATPARDSRLEFILEWVRELTGELDLRALTGTILQGLLQATGMERGFVILQEDERLAVMQSHHIRPEDCREDGEESLSWSLTRRALAQGRPLVTADAQREAGFSLASSVKALDLRAVMVLPFQYRGRPLGAVYLDSRCAAEPGSTPDLAYLSGLADILGLAVRNASLFESRARELNAAQRALERSQEELELKYQYQNLIGRAPATRAFLQRVDRVTEVRVPVLILGESGVGKELVARAIHFNGPLKKGPFVAANCGAIPENLVESELFGHERGAFTGALESRPGLFEQAHRGTLFLDEIGDMPAATQAKLLRVLQEGELRRVGGVADRKVEVRVIAATHRNLKEDIRQGRFREDLYYRLAVAEIQIPPLRERREDIPLLVDHFLEKFAAQNGAAKKAVDPRVLGALLQYEWRGNIRELENLVYNLCIFSAGDKVLPEDLRQRPELAALLDRPLPPPAERRRRAADPLREALDRGEINLSEAKRRFEREEIVRILTLHEGKVGEAAKHLGIPRPQLSRLLGYHRLAKGKDRRNSL